MKLDDRFHVLERTKLPEVWDEATARATREGDAKRRVDGDLGRRAPKAIAVLLVVAVFSWAFIGLERSLRPGSDVSVFSPGQIARYPVPDAQPLVFGGGWTWASGAAGNSTEIYRIDASTGTTTPLPETRGAQWVAFGEGYAWALCGGDSDSPCTVPVVMKIDPATGEVIDRIRTPGPGSSVVTGLGAVWVATGEGIVRIDPSSDRISQTFGGIAHVAQLAIGGGRVWGTSLDGGKIGGLDPTSGAVVASVPFEDPCMITAGAEGVFVASCGGPVTRGGDSLIRIDPTTGSVDLTVPLPTNAVGELTLFDGRLWVGAWVKEHAEVTPLDPASGLQLGEPVQLPISTHGFGVSGFGPPGLFLAGGAGSLWITHVDADDVIRIGVTGAPAAPSLTFGRFLFSGRGVNGVLEMESSPQPSVCYDPAVPSSTPMTVIRIGVTGRRRAIPPSWRVPSGPKPALARHAVPRTLWCTPFTAAIESVLTASESFCGEVLQKLRPWKAAPPKLKKAVEPDESPEEVVAEVVGVEPDQIAPMDDQPDLNPSATSTQG